MELRQANISMPGGLKGREDLRFKLFEWLKEQDLTVDDALHLLSFTVAEIKIAMYNEKL